MSGGPGAVQDADPEQSSPVPPAARETPDGRPAFRWGAAALLGAAGFLLNLLPLQLSPGIDMIFGGIPVLLAAVAFGPLHGLLAGTIAAARTPAIWGHPWGWPIFALEAAAVGLIVQRLRVRPMVADLAYWAVLGVPLLYLTVTFALDASMPTFGVLALKQTLNGVFNTVLVEMLLLIPLVRRAIRIPIASRLQSAIAVVVTTAAILPALVFGIWMGRREWARNIAESEARVLLHSQAYASKLEQFVMLHESAIRSSAMAVQRWTDLEPAELQRMVSVMRQQFPGFLEVHAADSRGVVLASESLQPAGWSSPGSDNSGQAHFARLREMRRTLASDLIRSPEGEGIRVVVVAHPFAHADTFAGYILGALDLRGLPEPSPPPDEGERLLVADANGALLFNSRLSRLAGSSTVGRADSAAFALIRSGGVPATAVYEPGGRERRPGPRGLGGDPLVLAGVAAIPGLGWWVWMEKPYTQIQQFITESYLRLFSLLIAVSLLALALSTALARYLAHPLLRLRAASAALAGGNLVARVGRLPAAMPSEIRDLGAGFDDMASALTGRHEELEELGDIARSLASALDLRLLLPRITEAVERLVDPDGVGIVLVSDAGTTLRSADYALGILADTAGREIPVEASVTGWVTRTGRSVLILETRGDPRIRGGYVDPDTARSVICAPLKGRSGVLGALTAVRARKSHRTFGDDDLHLLERLAGNAAVAVENARLLEAAEAASRAKSSFIATMSHELRTPLNGLLGNLELLEMGIYGELSARQRATLARMQSSTQQLRDLIEGVLSFSRLESGRIEVQLAETDLWRLVREAGSMVEPLARDKGLEFEVRCDLPEGRLATVLTDPDKVRQILIHLAGNAVKFTTEGRVSMVLHQTDGESRITIADSGVGIAPDDQKRLFRPFEPLESGLSRHHGGAGLGLYLSGRYAEVIGAKILVESAPGEGSAFTLVLPHPKFSVAGDGGHGEAGMKRLRERQVQP